MDFKIKIRQAKLTDWRNIQYIQSHDSFEHVYYLKKSRIERLFKRGEVFFLAFIDGKAVGFTSVDFEIRATVHFLSVLKPFQDMGVGRALLKRALQEAIKRKYKQAVAFTEDVAVKEKFLTKNKFKKVGYHKNRYANRVNGIIWSIDLPSHKVKEV